MRPRIRASMMEGATARVAATLGASMLAATVFATGPLLAPPAHAAEGPPSEFIVQGGQV